MADFASIGHLTHATYFGVTFLRAKKACKNKNVRQITQNVIGHTKKVLDYFAVQYKLHLSRLSFLSRHALLGRFLPRLKGPLRRPLFLSASMRLLLLLPDFCDPDKSSCDLLPQQAVEDGYSAAF